MEVIRLVSKILALPLVLLVYVYQKVLSPDHGLLSFFYPYGYCKFYPTCSEYGRLVLIRDGVIGIPKIIKRVVSCRPNATPRIDHP
jgi:putative component of membrane protein insertase Oxa1/YidC/SpoIIIJ protein YidD